MPWRDPARHRWSPTSRMNAGDRRSGCDGPDPAVAAGRRPALAVSRGLPMKSLLLAAHCLTLQRVSGEADVTTGLVTHGRARPVRAPKGRRAVPQHDSDPARRQSRTLARRRRTRSPIRAREPSLSALPVAGHAVRCRPPTVQCGVRLRQLPPVRRAGRCHRGRTPRVRGARADKFRAVGDRRDRSSNRPAVATGEWRSSGLTAVQAREYANSFVRVLAAIVRSPERAIDSAADELAARDVVQLVSEQAAANPMQPRWSPTRQLDVCRIGPRRRTNRSRLVGRRHAAGSACRCDAGSLPRADRDRARRPEGRGGGCAVGRQLPRARIDVMIDRARPFRVISDIAEVRALLEDPCDDDAAGDRPRKCGIRVVHVGLDRRTQGRHDAAPGARQPDRVAEPASRPAPSAVPRCSSPRCPSTSRFRRSSRRCAAAAHCGWCPRRSARICRRWCACRGRDGSSVIFLPYVALQAFAEAASSRRTRLESLRVVISSGEQLRVTPEIRRLCAANPGLVLENQYGPTETHVVASYTMSGSPDDFPDAAADRHRDRRRNDQRCWAPSCVRCRRNQG